MRKLYALLTGLCIGLVGSFAVAQNSVPDSCRADFERINVTATANPLTATFRALPWHNNQKKPVRICWEFGDGSDTCIQYSNTTPNPPNYIVSHTYTAPGNYEVCVKILYVGGCEARKCKHVQVGPVPDSCRADFERLPTTSITPQFVGFKALPWHNNNKKPMRICWTFGDGSDTCINYTNSYVGNYNVFHAYQSPGLYEVCVKIFYYGGCDARKCKPIQVGRPDTCRADFETIPLNTGTTTLTRAFRALPWHNNNKKPARICWEFGDGRDTCINYGADYNGQYTVSHTYAQPGQYEVCVKILYYGGCEARKCKLVSIPHPPATCSVRVFEITPSINSLTRGFLAVPNSVPNRRPIRICWDFGDGSDTCINLTNTTPTLNLFITHTFPGPGVYRVCAKVIFEGGCVARDCEEVVIRRNANVCGGYMVDSLIAPRSYRFKGYSIHNPNDEVIHYRWTFGDGTSALGQEVTHTYNVGGNYEVCLYIKTRLGCETRICKPLRVPGSNQTGLILSPNPVINVLNATFFSTHTEPVTIRILNSMGTVVRTYSRNATIGPNTWSFDLTTLTGGVYSFVVQSPNQLASAIFIKL